MYVMSLNHIYTPEEENQLFGRDMMVEYLSTGGLDLKVDGTGDIQLSNGLAELTISAITMLLSTVYDYLSGNGELPFHPTFGSSLPRLLLSADATEEQIDLIQNEIYLSVFSNFSDIVAGVEFPYVGYDSVNRTLELHINVYTVTGSLGSVVMVV